ncbi:MAG: hypothetical protein PHY62_06360 [Gallionella sp.]|nr:hypothetical protein [Gallionella sp.]
MNQYTILTITLLSGIVSNVWAAPSENDTSALGNVKIIDAKEARRNDPFAILRDKPMSENQALIPQLTVAANMLPPQYLYELARRLWLTDKSAAMEWFAVGMARARYDALRCVDTTSHQGISYLSMIAPDVAKGAEADRAAFGEAGLRAMARPDLFIDSISPSWICNHGIKAINSALSGKPMNERDWLRPPSEWEGIRIEVRKDLTHFFSEQGKPQDDPIPMTTAKFPRTTLAGMMTASYGWLDSERLVATIADKDVDGKPVKRVVVLERDGKQDDVAVTDGMWCAGNGTLSYQTEKEVLPDKSLRITLASGMPGKWSSRTLELRYPFLDIFGPQNFGQSWSLPSNATRQSPFDCRWVTDETLSGPKNANQWFPLLKDDGSILFETEAGKQQARWIDAKGMSIVLPVDVNRISLSSFRYLGWKKAYFVTQTWSRFSHKEKTLPSCIPGAYIYPKETRVEEVCVPFDTANTANAVMFHPTKIGWLRGTIYRNTPHGVKTGGIYLVRPNEKVEKLVDGQLENWSVSPDGCRVAFSLRPAEGKSSLEVIDLCSNS